MADLLVRAAENRAAAYRRCAESAGRPRRTDPDLTPADLGLPASLPTQSATLRAPMTDGDVDSVVERVGAFFDGAPGGYYQIWSIWPTPDLSPMGFASWGTPCMARAAGGEGPSAPQELEIREADDRAALDAVDVLVGDALATRPSPGATAGAGTVAAPERGRQCGPRDVRIAALNASGVSMLLW